MESKDLSTLTSWIHLDLFVELAKDKYQVSNWAYYIKETRIPYGYKLSIDLPRYDLKEYTKNHNFVKKGKGSYTSEINRLGTPYYNFGKVKTYAIRGEPLYRKYEYSKAAYKTPNKGVMVKTKSIYVPLSTKYKFKVTPKSGFKKVNEESYYTSRSETSIGFVDKAVDKAISLWCIENNAYVKENGRRKR